jgi:hypothetical protein
MSNRDIVEWIAVQLAGDEAWLVDHTWTHRLDFLDPTAPGELAKLKADRVRLDTMTVREAQAFAAKYSRRPGYRLEWRPA